MNTIINGTISSPDLTEEVHIQVEGDYQLYTTDPMKGYLDMRAELIEEMNKKEDNIDNG